MFITRTMQQVDLAAAQHHLKPFYWVKLLYDRGFLAKTTFSLDLIGTHLTEAFLMVNLLQDHEETGRRG
jgi:hypothetical protein